MKIYPTLTIKHMLDPIHFSQQPSEAGIWDPKVTNGNLGST